MRVAEAPRVALRRRRLQLRRVRLQMRRPRPWPKTSCRPKTLLPEESFKVEKMAMSQTDEDFVMECAVGEEAELTVEIEPMFLMATEYFYGFTADSDPKISMDRDASADIEGEMAAKGHKGNVDDEERNIKIVLKFRPDSAGEFVAHLCFMFPTEKAFSKFYKITAKAGADPDATRG